MANKFGLYIKDDTEHLNREGYPEASPTPSEDVWTRTGLYYNGKPITKTSIERNKFGIHVVNNKEVLLNGSNVADLTSIGKFGIKGDNNQVVIGDTILSRPSGVIDITLTDYNQLRSGHRVEGYARYNDLAVYRIVDYVENVNNNIEFEPPEGIYDIIYNSYTNDLKETPLSVNTILDPNTPELAMRHVDQYGKEGEGITIEYFVDTKYYDSINKGVIGDRFTVIVEDSFGRNIYKHTTYAGHFRITTDAFLTEDKRNNLTGETWFSIRCVDSKGRGSCEWFFSVFIRSTSYTENLYPVTSDDLSYYGITPNSNSNDPVAAYKNRLGFTRLIVDVKNGVKGSQWNGIKFYNPNPNIADIKNNQNYAYYINIYPDIDHITEDRTLTDNSYKTRATNSFTFPTQDYYIFKYHAGSSSDPAKLDTIHVKNAGSDAYTTASFEVVDGVDSAIDWSKLTHENIEAFKIEPGKSFIIDGRTVTIPNDADIVDWIWNDGAGICRDGNKIIRHEDGPSDYDPQHETYVKDWRNSHCVRCITINANRKAAIRRYKASYNTQVSTDKDGIVENYPFKPGEGYYYVSFYSGTQLDGICDRHGISDLPVLDDFIIDFNYSSWKLLDAYLIQGRSNLLELGLSKNVEVRNAWIKGVYDGSESSNQEQYTLNLIKRGYITQNIITLVPWEGCGLVNIIGGRFCTFNNVHLTGSLGYEYMAHCPGSHAYIVPEPHRVNFPSSCVPGYINITDGNLINNSTAIVKQDGNSLLSNTSVDYEESTSTDICLATTPTFISLNNLYMVGVKSHLVYGTNSDKKREYNDEFVIGNFDDKAGGKYSELFVSFYDANDNYIRTIKTQVNRRIKKLGNANKIKITIYLTGTLRNNLPRLYLPLKVTKRFTYYNMEGCGITESVVYKDCEFGISKTGVLETSAINMTIIDSLFSNNSYTPKGIATENPYAIGSEEHGCVQMLLNFTNSQIVNIAFGAENNNDTDSTEENESHMRVTPHNQINFSRIGTFVNIRNCVGFIIHGHISSSYIADSYVYALSNSISPRYERNSQVVSKHCIIKNGGSWDTRSTFNDKELAYLTEDIYNSETQLPCSSCEEPINLTMSFEDCFFNKPNGVRNGRIIKGRLYHSTKYPFDIYTSMTYDRLIALWNKRLIYDTTDGNEGWIHMIVFNNTKNKSFLVGKSCRPALYTDNANDVITYIDGERVTGAFTTLTSGVNIGFNKISIPTTGYHLISYKVARPLGSKGRYIGIPNRDVDVLYIRFPNKISDTLTFAEAFVIADDENVEQDHIRDNDAFIQYMTNSTYSPITQFMGDVPPKLWDPRSVTARDIYVPKGKLEVYLNYFYYYLDSTGNLRWYNPYGVNQRVTLYDEDFDLNKLL